jgi:prepilin-type N-terminal cleavage/methylation domain-containing protein
MRRNRTQNFAAAGFTMLELIVAMAMVALLSLTLFSALTVAYSGKRAAERAIKPARTASIAIEMIGRDLQSVFPPDIRNSNAINNGTTNINQVLPAYAGPFYGETSNGAAQIQFCCLGDDATPGAPLSEGIRQVELTLATDPDNRAQGSMLVRRVTKNLMATSPAEPEEEVLCRNVQSFSARYYDSNPTAPSWYDSWDSTQVTDSRQNPAVPAAVELTLVLSIDNSADAQSPKPVNYTVRRVIPISCSAQ